MQCSQVLLVVIVILNCIYAQDINDNLLNNNNNFRDKRQESSWVWGERQQSNKRAIRAIYNRSCKESRREKIKEINNLHLTNTATTTAAPDQPNPCNVTKPKKPNFNAGRRISEAKCYEYIWELKNRDDDHKNLIACSRYNQEKLEKLGKPRPHFAIGGRATLPGEFPHMGALGWRAVIGTWLFKCGSSLISSKYLLTAAHCSRVSSKDSTVANPSPEIVRLGDKNIIDEFANGQNPKDVKILRIIVHPQYNPPKKYFDIALIELVEEVTFDKYIQPACLWSKTDTSPLGTKASLTGWGTVDSAKQKTSPELQAAFVDVVDTNLCNQLLRPAFNRHFNGVQSHQLCAGVLAGGVDSCQGDSGGPLQMKISLPITTEGSISYVIGITSFGYGCARADTPGVYTRVSSFIDWIENIVWA